MATAIEQNLHLIRQRIADAAQAASRRAAAIRLLPVTKGQPAATLRELARLGFNCVGESYLNELREKKASVEDLSLSYSFIGTLQSNKLKQICQLADEIQSVPSLRYLQLIEQILMDQPKARPPLAIWLVVNAGDEDSKTGFTFAELEAARTAASATKHLRLMGLMAIPPAIYLGWNLNKDGVPPLYQRLRIEASRTGEGLLSLGMSGDLELAVAAGTDCLRIGTALCGERPAR